ncbi:MAG: cytochrome C oxidase subunit IV family protein [Bacteroidales bacterium]|nr:cytochrome C oxidase subunit IV family protein [Bacteroidales bacterium]
MSEHKSHVTGYRTHLMVLAALLVLTSITVGITRLELGPLNTTAAMLIAGLKAFIVLAWFMHLKFESAFYKIMVTLVFILFLLILLVTFFDYWFRT